MKQNSKKNQLFTNLTKYIQIGDEKVIQNILLFNSLDIR